MGEFIDDVQVLRVLRGFNPWWTGQAVQVPPFRRVAYRVCLNYLTDERLRRGVLLSGPRRVGKTTILNQIADTLVSDGVDPAGILYLSLDHPLLKLISLSDILRIWHEHQYPQDRKAYLLLDEVQYAGDWELELKHLIDHGESYRILATGSASVVHRQRLSESGVGRWTRVAIPTLSFYEFLEIRGERPSGIPAALRPSDLLQWAQGDLDDMASRFSATMPLFTQYLLVGGFPETADLEDVGLCQRLLREDVVERVLKRDMTALFGIRNVNDLEKLFIYVCLNSGGVLSVKTCADALGVSPTTVSSHLTALEQANLIYRVAPYRLGGKKVLKAQNKIYLVDAALRNAVLLRGREMLTDPAQMGMIVETTILRHIYAYHYRDIPTIAYWREPQSEREVDIIVASPAYLIPIEVKYRERADLTARDGLPVFCDSEDVTTAYLVTKSESDLGPLETPGSERSILRVPAHIFAYLLGQAERLLWMNDD